MSKKYLYYFSEGNDAFGGDKVTMKNTLGGKGAGLAEMTAAGMPVPQGFTITTDACTQYYADGRQINDEITAATTPTPCWSPSVPAHVSPCPA